MRKVSTIPSYVLVPQPSHRQQKSRMQRMHGASDHQVCSSHNFPAVTTHIEFVLHGMEQPLLCQRQCILLVGFYVICTLGIMC